MSLTHFNRMKKRFKINLDLFWKVPFYGASAKTRIESGQLGRNRKTKKNRRRRIKTKIEFFSDPIISVLLADLRFYFLFLFLILFPIKSDISRFRETARPPKIWPIKEVGNEDNGQSNFLQTERSLVSVTRSS